MSSSSSTSARTARPAGGALRISEQDVRDATRQFSEWKLLDLAREYQVNFPFLAQVFVMFENFGYIVTRQSLQRRIQTHEASLRRQFPAYADAFVVDAVLGVLYAIGFLGVKRGNDVVYAGGAHAGIQPSESEFHIHPCFRVALARARGVGHPRLPGGHVTLRKECRSATGNVQG